MSELPPPSGAARPGDAAPVRPFDASPAAIGVSLATVAGTVLLGLAAGYLWSRVAPRASLVIINHGAAGLVQAETTAFIAADAAFCLIAVAGGVVSGALGYLVGVRRHGPLPMIAVLAGALGASYLARWVGQQLGLASFHHLLATLTTGAHLSDSLTLQTTGAIAFWPLAAGLVAGGLEAFATRDQARHRAAARRAAREGSRAGPGGLWLRRAPAGQRRVDEQQDGQRGTPDGQHGTQDGQRGTPDGQRGAPAAQRRADGQPGGQSGAPAWQPGIQPRFPGSQGHPGHE